LRAYGGKERGSGKGAQPVGSQAPQPTTFRTMPSPSLKPRPNGKPPGPGHCAAHRLQRGPGVFPLLQAWLDSWTAR